MTAPDSSAISDEYNIKYENNLKNIVSVDTSQIVDVELSARFFWKDSCLTWNKLNTNISYIIFQSDEIWKPEFKIYTATGLMPYINEVIEIAVLADGRAEMEFTKRFKIQCKGDAEFFPNDISFCTVNFFLSLLNKYSIDKYNESNRVCEKSLYEVYGWYYKCDKCYEQSKVNN